MPRQTEIFNYGELQHLIMETLVQGASDYATLARVFREFHQDAEITGNGEQFTITWPEDS